MSRKRRQNAPIALFGVKPSWKALAVAAAGLILVSLGVRRRALSSGAAPSLTGFELFKQADPRWSNLKIGFSNTSIGHAGCLLTALTMASNYLRGSSIRPDDANEMGKNVPGSFSGDFAVVPVLASALGLSAPESLRIRSSTRTSVLNTRAKAAFDASGVVIFHVDHNNSFSTGEHFLLCFGVNQGQYICADPATGNYTTIDPGTMKGPGFSGKTYTVLGVIPVFRKNQVPATLP